MSRQGQKTSKYQFPEKNTIKTSGFPHFGNHCLEDLKKKIHPQQKEKHKMLWKTETRNAEFLSKQENFIVRNERAQYTKKCYGCKRENRKVYFNCIQSKYRKQSL